MDHQRHTARLRLMSRFRSRGPISRYFFRKLRNSLAQQMGEHIGAKFSRPYKRIYPTPSREPKRQFRLNGFRENSDWTLFAYTINPLDRFSSPQAPQNLNIFQHY